jgi:hypothetical protein
MMKHLEKIARAHSHPEYAKLLQQEKAKPLHKKPPLDTPQLAGGRKAEIRQRRILVLVYGK